MGECTLWHGGAHPAKLLASLHVPGSPGTGQWAVASGRSQRCGQHNAPAGQGLPCGGGSAGGHSPEPQCNSPCVNAVTRRRSACCPFLLLLLPAILPVHARGGGCSPVGLLLLQPSPCHGKWPPWARGDASSPCSGGPEPPEQCQRRLLLRETTSCRGRNLVSLQTSTGAMGISLQRLFFSGDLFPGLEC